MKYKCYAYINEVTWSLGNHGYACGYVIVPKEHPFYGKNIDDYINITDIDDVTEFARDNYVGLFCAQPSDKDKLRLNLLVPVHGGITYSCRYIGSAKFEFLTKEPDESKDLWVFGFDTLHCDDNEEVWNKENCITETLKFLSYLENIDDVDYIIKNEEI